MFPKKAIKNLEEIYIGMLSPISVSFNKVQAPATSKCHTIPAALKPLQADTFVRSTSNISFTSVDNSAIGDALRELGDVPCPYCGTRIIRGKEISHLKDSNLGGKSKDAIKLLKPFEDRMHPIEKQVFGILEDLSKQYPNKNLREALDTVRPQHLENVKQQEFDIFKNMSKYVNKNIKDETQKSNLNKLINESVGIIEKQDENYIFRRRRFMEKLGNITKNMTDENLIKGVKEIAEELPKSQDNVSTFIVKYTQKDPKTKQEKSSFQLGLALVEPSVGSLEHIVPRHPQDKTKKGGENKYSNYIYASREWNTKRQNMPLDKWVTLHPEIKENMQKYMDAVIEKINSGKAMKKCKEYPLIVAKTLEEESKGLLKLDTSKLKLEKPHKKPKNRFVEMFENLKQVIAN